METKKLLRKKLNNTEKIAKILYKKLSKIESIIKNERCNKTPAVLILEKINEVIISDQTN